MKKKIYYYKLDLNSYTRINYSNEEIKECLIKAINGQNTIRLNDEKNDKENIINMDILSNDEDFLFFRIGKAIDDNNGLIRDIITSEVSELDENKILEVYTYGFIDYKYCIVGYLNSKQAPSAKFINGLCQYLDDEMYSLNLNNISSKDTVNALCKPGSVINKIEYSFLHPNMSILAGLGLSRSEVEKITLDKKVKIKLVITNEKRGILVSSLDKIKEICNIMSSNKIVVDKKIRGKTENGNLKDYTFELENFYSEIDINTTIVEDDKIKKLTLNQVAKEFKTKAKNKYLEDRRLILLYANIES